MKLINWFNEAGMDGSRVSKRYKNFFIINTGINGIRISLDIPVFLAVFSSE